MCLSSVRKNLVGWGEVETWQEMDNPSCLSLFYEVDLQPLLEENLLIPESLLFQIFTGMSRDPGVASAQNKPKKAKDGFHLHAPSSTF
jgi:hypothetical protein